MQASGRSQTNGFVIVVTVSTKGQIWAIEEDTHKPQKQMFPSKREPSDHKKDGADTVSDKQCGCVCMESIRGTLGRFKVHMPLT